MRARAKARSARWATKIAIAAGGLVAAAASSAAATQGLFALGIVVTFAAITTAWFILDGYEQTHANGQDVLLRS